MTFKSILIIVALFCVNNLVWWHYQATPDAQPTVQQAAAEFTQNSPGPCMQATDAADQEMPAMTPAVAGTKVDKTQLTAEPEDPITAMQPHEKNTFRAEEVLPAESSERFLAERERNREAFYFDDEQSQIATIQALTPQGEDLQLLTDIIQTHESPSLRAAAIERLQYQNSYVAITALLDALDDSSEDVVLASLVALNTSGDRSLLPTLESKFLSLPEGDIKDQLGQTIKALDFSVTMEMDGLR